MQIFVVDQWNYVNWTLELIPLLFCLYFLRVRWNTEHCLSTRPNFHFVFLIMSDSLLSRFFLGKLASIKSFRFFRQLFSCSSSCREWSLLMYTVLLYRFNLESESSKMRLSYMHGMVARMVRCLPSLKEPMRLQSIIWQSSLRNLKIDCISCISSSALSRALSFLLSSIPLILIARSFAVLAFTVGFFQCCC